MRAGTLRHTVAADEPVSVSDQAGGSSVEWMERFTFRAAVQPISGAELLRAEQVMAGLDTRITARRTLQTAAIRPNWRLRHGGVIYNIVRPPIDSGGQLEILVRSGLNKG